MRKLINNNEELCTGCNRCIRVCPVEGANTVYDKNGHVKVKINEQRCISCGACIAACTHNVRDYEDDTERFLSDLRNGVPISMFAAPANRANGEDVTYAGRIITWLKNLGVRKVYDVSLGADICTWAHIRYIQKNSPKSVITQPCPAIVSYVLIHNHNLIKYLSPIHSPMLCTAVYMKKYCGVTDRIAALSPCIAKTHEFEDTSYVHYNVTLKKLYDYIEKNGIRLPREETGFDHPASELGCLYSMPGGLKENVEFYLGKALRIDQCEGQSVVYNALKEFGEQREFDLPPIFDVLNCPEGCNLGTGCRHNRNRFQASAIMEANRKKTMEHCDKAEIEKVYAEYDTTLRLSDFIRRYTPVNIKQPAATEAQIEKAFADLGKETYEQRNIDCAACGSNSCYDMAHKIALGFNMPKNCIHKIRNDISKSHNKVYKLQKDSLADITELLQEITDIRKLSDDIVNSIVSVNEAIKQYDKMSRDIDFIASHINIISVNASIEAARAGQHGKSFAIIADEIRSLAGSSHKTVAQTAEISDEASKSAAVINDKIANISGEINKAHNGINSIHKKISSIMVEEGKDIYEYNEL